MALEWTELQDAALSFIPEQEETIQEEQPSDVITKSITSDQPIEQYLPLYISFGGNQQQQPKTQSDQEQSNAIMWAFVGVGVLVVIGALVALFKK